MNFERNKFFYFNKVIILILLIFSFSSVYGATTTGNMLLNWEFNTWETKNTLDLIVFGIIFTLILVILQETIGKKINMSPLAFKSLSIILILSYLWVLLTAFGGDALFLFIIFFALIANLLLGVGAFYLTNNYSFSLLKGKKTGIALIVGISLFVFTNSIIFSNIQGIEQTLVGDIISIFSFKDYNGLLILIGTLIFSTFFYGGLRDSKAVNNPVASIKKNSEDIEKIKKDFLEHFQVLRQLIHRLIILSQQESPDNEKENKRNEIVRLISMSKLNLNKLTQLTSKKVNSTILPRGNINPFGEESIIQKINELTGLISHIQNSNYVLDSTIIQQINSLYNELNELIVEETNQINLAIADMTHIQERIENIRTNYLSKFKNKLSKPKLKIFISEEDKIIAEMISHFLKISSSLSGTDRNEKEKEIESIFITNIEMMIHAYPNDNNKVSNSKITQISSQFRKSLKMGSIDFRPFWEDYFLS